MAVRACFLSRHISRLWGSGNLLAANVSKQSLPPVTEQLHEKTLSTLCRNSQSSTSSNSLQFQTFNNPLFTTGNLNQLLLPVATFSPVTFQTRGYKSALRPRLICEGCYFVWRHGRKHVECSDHPRHKQMKKVATRKAWREDYSKGNISAAMDWHKQAPRQFIRTGDKTSLSHNWLAGKLGHEI